MEESSLATAIKSAHETYGKLSALMQRVGLYFEKKSQGSFSSDLFVGQFDLALQIVLFDTIIADGSCGPKEIEAIKSIPEHNDLIVSLRGLVGDDFKARVLGWDELEQSDARTLQIFSELLETYADRMIENFVHFVALYDDEATDSDKKVIVRLEKGFLEIAITVASAGGPSNEVETRVAHEKVASLLQEKYEQEMAKLLKEND
jgi:hypothetical protein